MLTDKGLTKYKEKDLRPTQNVEIIYREWSENKLGSYIARSQKKNWSNPKWDSRQSVQNIQREYPDRVARYFKVRRLKNYLDYSPSNSWKIPRQLVVRSFEKKMKIFSEFLTVNTICLFTCTAMLFQAHDNKCCNNITLTANAFLHPALIKQLTTTAEITPFG